jgi:hypothetical protein
MASAGLAPAVLLVFLSLVDLSSQRQTNFLVGVGRADVTGPAADVNMVIIKLYIINFSAFKICI